MIVKTTDDIRGTKGEVKTQSWSSYRFLQEEDGMGVTLTDAILEPGLDQAWWYKNHLEAVYCLEGEGTLEDLSMPVVFVERIQRTRLDDVNLAGRTQGEIKDAGRVHFCSTASGRRDA